MNDAPVRLRAERAAEYLGVSVATLAKWRWKGIGPRFVRIGRSIRYPLDELQHHLAANTHQSTSEYLS